MAQLPPLAVLTPLVMTRGAKRLTMTTIQLGVISASEDSWAADHEERNITIDRHEFVLTKTRTTYDASPMFAVSQHALARRAQPACGPSTDEAVAALVAHRVTEVPPPPLEIAVPVPGGTWLGVTA